MSAAFDLPLGAPVIVHGPDYDAIARPLETMRRYGTNIAGWVTPSTDGGSPDRLPRFRRFADAVDATRATACVSLAAPRNAADAALEAAQAGIALIVTVTAGVPVHDCLRVRHRIDDLGAVWVGPGSTGVARPSARLMLGQVPEAALRPGPIAVIADCGSLGAEIGLRMSAAGLGISLFLDIGDSTAASAHMAGLLNSAAADPETRSIALLFAGDGRANNDFLSTVQPITDSKPILAYAPAGTAQPEPTAAGADTTSPPALAAAGATLYNSPGALLAALKASC